MSRQLGLQSIVLMPISPSLAGFVLGGSWAKRKECKKAFEVHIDPCGKGEIDQDIQIIEERITGLLIWETAYPLPSRVRKKIREAKEKGNAIWEKGTWDIPRVPFLSVDLDKARAWKGAYWLDGKGRC